MEHFEGDNSTSLMHVPIEAVDLPVDKSLASMPIESDIASLNSEKQLSALNDPNSTSQLNPKNPLSTKQEQTKGIRQLEERPESRKPWGNDMPGSDYMKHIEGYNSTSLMPVPTDVVDLPEEKSSASIPFESYSESLNSDKQFSELKDPNSTSQPNPEDPVSTKQERAKGGRELEESPELRKPLDNDMPGSDYIGHLKGYNSTSLMPVPIDMWIYLKRSPQV